MKLQAPEDCGGATFAGEEIKLDDKGQCEVSGAAAIEALKAHGFVEVSPEKKAALAKKDK